jgi:hypothetical protein
MRHRTAQGHDLPLRCLDKEFPFFPKNNFVIPKQSVYLHRQKVSAQFSCRQFRQEFFNKYVKGYESED